MKQFSRLLAAMLTFAPFVASAHPGHDHSEGAGGFTITHYFTTPLHLITTLAVAAIVIGVVRAVRTKDQKI